MSMCAWGMLLIIAESLYKTIALCAPLIIGSGNAMKQVSHCILSEFDRYLLFKSTIDKPRISVTPKNIIDVNN